MSSGLQRIEATLAQLGHQITAQTEGRAVVSFDLKKPNADSPMMAPTPVAEASGVKSLDLPFFEAPGQVNHPPSPPSSEVANSPTLSFTLSPRSTKESNPDAVPPFQAKRPPSTVPTLPKAKLPAFSSSRQVTKPEFALGLLKEIEELVTGWQKDLQGVLLKIQDLYLEGPIVDGWLESQSNGPSFSGPAVLRHAEIDRLMEYVEEICKSSTAEGADAIRTDYRLCGLDADGQLWSRPCPSEQVPVVGLAIARYQKLRQLQAERQTLENRLNQFAQSLINLHKEFQAG